MVLHKEAGPVDGSWFAHLEIGHRLLLDFPYRKLDFHSVLLSKEQCLDRVVADKFHLHRVKQPCEAFFDMRAILSDLLR